jgi:hypothetical protein
MSTTQADLRCDDCDKLIPSLADAGSYEDGGPGDPEVVVWCRRCTSVALSEAR